jgi:hypothetical protein
MGTADEECNTECYTDCVSTFGPDSELCHCEQHGACISVCPHNCPNRSELLPKCFDSCVDYGISPETCATKCHECVVDKGCWVDATIESEEDEECKDTCYSECGVSLDPSSELCDCTHGACVSGCPYNCPMDLETRCYDDCMKKASYNGWLCQYKCGLVVD